MAKFPWRAMAWRRCHVFIKLATGVARDPMQYLWVPLQKAPTIALAIRCSKCFGNGLGCVLLANVDVLEQALVDRPLSGEEHSEHQEAGADQNNEKEFPLNSHCHTCMFVFDELTIRDLAHEIIA